MAVYSEKNKKEYLKYFERTKKQGRRPQTFALWRKIKRMGGSRQMQGQLRGLSQDDAAEIYKKFGVK